MIIYSEYSKHSVSVHRLSLGFVSGIITISVAKLLLLSSIGSLLFDMCRSSRQGCSLSQILYALCMEPLANKLQRHMHFKGVPIHGLITEAPVSLNAYDSLMFAATVKCVMSATDVLNQYGRASGARLNHAKCQIMVVRGSFLPQNLPPWLKVAKIIKLCGVFSQQCNTPM